MKMKQKTKKAAAKRFKVKKSGKVMREAVGKRHLMQHKTKKSKRHKRHNSEVSATDMPAIKIMLGSI